MDCVFCKISAREVPAHIVYEDEEFLALLDIFPVSRGHIQVISKQHYRWVWDVPNIGGYFEIARKIAQAQKKAFRTEYVQCLVAGDQVPHAHIWVVPVYEGDPTKGGCLRKEGGYTFNHEEAPQLVADIMKNMH